MILSALNRMLLTISTAILFACSASAQTVAAQSEYAYGWTVATETTADYYQIVLPLEFYASVSDADLRDVGVYNADGNAVPRLIRQPYEKVRDVEKSVELNVYPLPTYPSAEAGARGKLVFEQRGDRTSLTYDNAPDAAVPATTQPSAYVLDAREIRKPLQQLTLSWPDGLEGFVGEATIMSSDDLDRWYQAGNGAIAELSAENERIVRRTVPLRDRAYKYLKVSVTGVPANWSLTGARAKTREQERRTDAIPSMIEATIAPDEHEDETGYVFTVPGSPLIDAANIELPADNSVLRATLYSSRGPVATWRRVGSHLFYHLRRDGNAIQNEPLAFDARRAPRWKLVIESGRTDLQPKLSLRWRPDVLAFVAQGTGPYTVVAGRAADRGQGFPQEKTMGDPAIFRILERSGPATVARLTQRRTLLGESSLTESVPLPWKTWLLWAGLIAGVLLVAGMVYRLLQQQQTTS